MCFNYVMIKIGPVTPEYYVMIKIGPVTPEIARVKTTPFWTWRQKSAYPAKYLGKYRNELHQNNMSEEY